MILRSKEATYLSLRPKAAGEFSHYKYENGCKQTYVYYFCLFFILKTGLSLYTTKRGEGV
jgi:hypothetical protein